MLLNKLFNLNMEIIIGFSFITILSFVIYKNSQIINLILNYNLITKRMILILIFPLFFFFVKDYLKDINYFLLVLFYFLFLFFMYKQILNELNLQDNFDREIILIMQQHIDENGNISKMIKKFINSGTDTLLIEILNKYLFYSSIITFLIGTVLIILNIKNIPNINNGLSMISISNIIFFISSTNHFILDFVEKINDIKSLMS
jgi:hypothetical protein